MHRNPRLSPPIALDTAADNRRHPSTGHVPTMIDRLDDYMRFQTEALKLRSQRQELLAANIANADTPGYKAVDFDFGKTLSAVATTKSGPAPAPDLLYREPAQASLDGNTVEMDAERAAFADNTVRYEAALKFLNTQLRTMLAALQG
jgi:flagellar basal-body rod protein FlgB